MPRNMRRFLPKTFQSDPKPAPNEGITRCFENFERWYIKSWTDYSSNSGFFSITDSYFAQGKNDVK